MNNRAFFGRDQAAVPARSAVEQLQMMQNMRHADSEQRARKAQLKQETKAREADLKCRNPGHLERKRLDSIEWQIKRASQKGQTHLIPALERERAEIKCQTYIPAPVTNINIRNW